MAKKGYSGSFYWTKHVAVAFVVIIVAVVVFKSQSDGSKGASPDSAPESKSVAKGLSEFYREFRMSPSEPIEGETGDFVLDITRPEQSLDGQLQSMASELTPVNNGWVGEHKHRTFKAGNTLRGAISAYAEQEGMQVIWDLEQDFVIKYQFQMENTVAGTLAKIATAIDSNFPGGVKTYLCPAQRSLVVTSNQTDYLKNSCKVVKPG